MAADRAEHIALIVAPALAAGEWVVSDRFSGSTLAYQGYGRGLEVEELQGMVAWATAGLVPDLSVLIDVPVEVAQARLAQSAPDRLERLGPEFAQRVRDGFLALALADGDGEHWVVVDGTVPVDELTARIVEVVRQRFGDPSGMVV
jgi:dTMP kinase